MAEHSFMMEPKIKNKICRGKMDIGQGRDVTTVRSDHLAGKDKMVAHILVLKPRLKERNVHG
jgi:hypothetical protein